MPGEDKILLKHPEAIIAYKIIKEHSATYKVHLPKPDKGGGFLIHFKMEVALPSRCRQSSISETGVRLREPIRFSFPKSYPFHAPTIYLRKDFNDKLPHINPLIMIDMAEGITPCIYDGSLDELLLRDADGLTDIINHLSEWLGKAAINDLIDSRQGWEPMRRDFDSGWIVYDVSEMRGLVTDKNDYAIFPGKFIQSKYAKNDSQIVFGIVDQSETLKLSAGLLGQMKRYRKKDSDEIKFDSMVFFIWADKGNDTNRYAPDEVATFDQFIENAEQYGCKGSLQNALNEFFWAGAQAGWYNYQLPIFIILCARRPIHMIGTDSNLELIAYKIDCKIEKLPSKIIGVGPTLQINPMSSVISLGHRHMLNPRLLRQMSGSDLNTVNGPVVMIGCGSVGSKIAMHLAKSGCGPFLLIDKGIFSPHNAARHALTFTELPLPKTELLADEISSLRQVATPIFSDVISLLDIPTDKSTAIPSNTSLIIETTGSIAVREKLASLCPESLPGRLFHAALYEQGRIGIIAVEGSSRNPNVNDLLVKFWNTRANNEQLSLNFFKNKDMVSRQDIGMGCGSHTMIMPDTRVSLYSAGMSEKARQIIEKGASEYGELWIGLLDDADMGVQWKKHSQNKSIILKICCNNEWEIRILQEAYNEITEEANKWGRIETGGVLIGRIFINRRCITIARVLEAPVDSTRSPCSFMLGTTDLRKSISKIFERSGGTLSYVGTWHSHPSGSGEPSSTDRQSYERLKALRLGAPSVFLIWTPNGLKAIIDEGKLS